MTWQRFVLSAGCLMVLEIAGSSGQSPSPAAPGPQPKGDRFHESSETGNHPASSPSPGPENSETMAPVTLKSEAIQGAGIEIVEVKKGEIAHAVSLTGSIMANQDQMAHLFPKVEGVARKVLKGVGDEVKVGEALAALDSAPVGEAKVEFLKALQDLQIAQAELERKAEVAKNTTTLIDLLEKHLPPFELEKQTKGLALGEFRGILLPAYSTLLLTRSAYEREERLFTSKVSSEKEYREAKKDYETAAASYTGHIDQVNYQYFLEHLTAEKTVRTREIAFQSAHRRLEILGATQQEIYDLRNRKEHDLSLYTVYSPLNGTVTEKHVTLGEKVTTETSLFTVIDLSKVWVIADVYEKDLGRVRAGMQAMIETTAYPGQIFSGVVTLLSPMIDPKTRTSQLRIVVDNTERLLAVGMFVKVNVSPGRETGTIAVPAAALQDIGGKTVVFVRETEDRFRPQPVKTGPRGMDIEMVEITSGLHEGDTIVGKGSFFLKSEMQKGEAQEE